MAKITPQQAKIVKAKVQAELTGVSQATIAKQLYPNASPGSAQVSVSRELKKANVQQALQIALAKHGLTPDSIIGVVGEAMKAEKTVIIGKEENAFADQVPDHGIRLKAAGMAAGFMGLNKNNEAPSLHFHQHLEDKKSDYEF